MAKKIINRKKRLTELEAKIKECDAYLSMESDPTAASRVSAIDSNPCASRCILY